MKTKMILKTIAELISINKKLYYNYKRTKEFNLKIRKILL